MTYSRNLTTSRTGCQFQRIAQIGLRDRLCQIIATLLLLGCTAVTQAEVLKGPGETLFQRVPTQYIAALGDWEASSGTGAESWGIWRVDPGPRGVWLRNYSKLLANGGLADANWQFDSEDWWLDENGLLMEKPYFPMPPGKYVVTGGRETVSILTIHPADDSGARRWELSDNATLYDVTHLECRSARYSHASSDQACSPANVDQSLFRIVPGDAMPTVDQCKHKEYIVLIVVGIGIGS